MQSHRTRDIMHDGINDAGMCESMMQECANRCCRNQRVNAVCWILLKWTCDTAVTRKAILRHWANACCRNQWTRQSMLHAWVNDCCRSTESWADRQLNAAAIIESMMQSHRTRQHPTLQFSLHDMKEVTNRLSWKHKIVTCYSLLLTHCLLLLPSPHLQTKYTHCVWCQNVVWCCDDTCDASAVTSASCATAMKRESPLSSRSGWKRAPHHCSVAGKDTKIPAFKRSSAPSDERLTPPKFATPACWPRKVSAFPNTLSKGGSFAQSLSSCACETIAAWMVRPFAACGDGTNLAHLANNYN